MLDGDNGLPSGGGNGVAPIAGPDSGAAGAPSADAEIWGDPTVYPSAAEREAKKNPAAVPGTGADVTTPTPSPVVQPAPATSVTPPLPPLSPELIAQIAGQAGVAAARASGAQPVQPQQLSPEELDKRLNVWKPTQQDVEDLYAGGDKAIATLARMNQGIIKQALTAVKILMEHQEQQIHAKYEPHAKFAEEQRERQVMDMFNKDYPQHTKLEPLIKQVALQLKAEGFNAGGDIKKLFAEVDKRVVAYATQLGIPASNVPGAPAPGQTQPPSMSTVSAGGQGGVGTSAGKSGGKDPTMAIWD